MKTFFLFHHSSRHPALICKSDRRNDTSLQENDKTRTEEVGSCLHEKRKGTRPQRYSNCINQTQSRSTVQPNYIFNSFLKTEDVTEIHGQHNLCMRSTTPVSKNDGKPKYGKQSYNINNYHKSLRQDCSIAPTWLKLHLNGAIER